MTKRSHTLALASMLLLAVSVAEAPPAEPCTLWAAAGESVLGNGTLVAKNRDWLPTDHQVLKLIEPKEGYRHFALLRDERHRRNVPAGINEVGLVAVSADTPFSQHERRKMPRTRNLNRKLLMHCATVADALKRNDWFIGPRFLMLADRHEIALVEVGPQGRVAVERKKDGVLYHTNHYTDRKLELFNPTVLGESTQARLKRIGHFMTKRTAFTLADFLSISRSRDYGPNRSVWRAGDSPKSRRTVASWIARIHPNGEFELRITLANPGTEPTHHRLKREDIFGSRH